MCSLRLTSHLQVVCCLLVELLCSAILRLLHQVFSLNPATTTVLLLLQVYQKLLESGLQPISTTYTALISAYGKAGQLDKALDTFQTMLQRGCERSVITYSALISACEKAGRWELALQLFEQMQREGCAPNTVTYNSLITACQQGEAAAGA
jgi:pentatricopeptide repeat domain-containing protein 1